MFAHFLVENITAPSRSQNRLVFAFRRAVDLLVTAARVVGRPADESRRDMYVFALAISIQEGRDRITKRKAILDWLQERSLPPARVCGAADEEKEDFIAALCGAVVADDIAILRHLTANMSPDECAFYEPYPFFGHPLLHAVPAGNAAMVRILLEHELSEDSTCTKYTEGGFTVSGRESEAAVLTLLEQLRFPHWLNDPNFERKTALGIVAARRHAHIAKMILDLAGASSDSRQSKVWMQLFRAAQRGHVPVVNAYLNRPRVRERCLVWQDGLLLIAAVWTRNLNIAKALLEVEDALPSPCHGALRGAIYNGDADMVKFLLEHKHIDINHRDMFNQSPLFLATGDFGGPHTRTYHKIVDALLARGDELHISIDDNEHYRLLRIAVLTGYAPLLRFILSRPEIVKNTNFNRTLGDTNGAALAVATRLGFSQIVRILIQDTREIVFSDPSHAVDINLRSPSGRTPLFLACMRGNYQIVRLLLQRDDLEVDGERVTDIEGQTPLSIARRNGHTGIERLLLAQLHVSRAHAGKFVSPLCHLLRCNTDGERPGLVN